MPDTLVLPPLVRAQLIARARWAAPHECCGLLVGRENVVDWAMPVRNAAASKHAYAFDLKDQERAFGRIAAVGLDLVGVYHSHPRTAAYPSAEDVRAAAYPEAAWLIVSLEDPRTPDVRAWRIVDGAVSEIALADG